MQTIHTIGLDLGKRFFQVHGADERGTQVLNRRLRREQVETFFEAAARLPGGDGNLWRVTSLGPLAGCDATRGEAGSGAIRQALREVEQERRSRRGGHLRGRATPGYAFCRGEGLGHTRRRKY